MYVKRKYSPINGLFGAVAYVFETIGVSFGTKGLRRFLIIPFILNIFALIVIIYFSFWIFYPWIISLIPGAEAWYLVVLRILLKVLTVLASFAVLFISYSVTGVIFCAPFIDPFTEKIERMVSKKIPENKITFSRMVGDVLRAMKTSFLILILIVVIHLFLLFLNFIPLIGPFVYSFLSFTTIMFFLGFQMFDSALARKEKSFRKKMRVFVEDPLGERGHRNRVFYGFVCTSCRISCTHYRFRRSCCFSCNVWRK